jgi:hypothetical protein
LLSTLEDMTTDKLDSGVSIFFLTKINKIPVIFHYFSENSSNNDYTTTTTTTTTTKALILNKLG